MKLQNAFQVLTMTNQTAVGINVILQEVFCFRKQLQLPQRKNSFRIQPTSENVKAVFFAESPFAFNFRHHKSGEFSSGADRDFFKLKSNRFRFNYSTKFLNELFRSNQVILLILLPLFCLYII